MSSKTVERHRAAEPDFAAEVEDARQEFADSQEDSLRHIGAVGLNPVGPIVLLKKHRPHEYIEKNLSITATFSTQLDPAQGQQLLQAMLGAMSPESRQALTAGEPTPPTPVIDVDPTP